MRELGGGGEGEGGSLADGLYACSGRVRESIGYMVFVFDNALYRMTKALFVDIVYR